MTGLAGSVAVITGVAASAGLGHSMAQLFAAQGAHVVGVDVRDDRGMEMESEIRACGGEFTFVRADVRRVEDCARIMEVALDRYGRIDILVNNAMTNPNPLRASHEVAEADWDNCMETILKGTFFCCRSALPVMLAQGSGVIVNIASGAAVGAWPVYRAYGAAKAGVLHVSDGLAEEYTGKGIRTHGIIMGAIASDEYAKQWSNSPAAEHFSEIEKREYVAQMLEKAHDPDLIAREIAAIAGRTDRWKSGDRIFVPGSRLADGPTREYVSRSSAGR